MFMLFQGLYVGELPQIKLFPAKFHNTFFSSSFFVISTKFDNTTAKSSNFYICFLHFFFLLFNFIKINK
jgi:hypothetical protein